MLPVEARSGVSRFVLYSGCHDVVKAHIKVVKVYLVATNQEKSVLSTLDF
jgi:hypothetical protein